MNGLDDAMAVVTAAQAKADRPLAIMLAGHNGSGKSTIWYDKLADSLQIPLINADRMMMSILPEVDDPRRLPEWAKALRDGDRSWMRVAQQGVQAFVALAVEEKAPFAMETVFSFCDPRPDGTYATKIDDIRRWQAAGYFVTLLFVGLSSPGLSIGRVETRKSKGGHGVPPSKLQERFGRTQANIRDAAPVADAAILLDNSRDLDQAFAVCRVQLRAQEVFDLRRAPEGAPTEISAWLDVVAPADAARAARV